MKSDKEKIKEWDELSKLFDMCHVKGDTLRQRCDNFIDEFEKPVLKLNGASETLKLIKHTKPYIEWIKVEYPNVCNPKQGIDYIHESNMVVKYFKEVVEIKYPATNTDTFLYLLRELKLMKDVHFSDQWVMAMLYEVEFP